MAKVYTELTAEGWLESRQGLGVFVAIPRQRLSDRERERRIDEAAQRFVDEVIALNYPADDALERVARDLRQLRAERSA